MNNSRKQFIRSGALSLTLGILNIVFGVTLGVLNIISGGVQLHRAKKLR